MNYQTIGKIYQVTFTLHILNSKICWRDKNSILIILINVGKNHSNCSISIVFHFSMDFKSSFRMGTVYLKSLFSLILISIDLIEKVKKDFFPTVLKFSHAVRFTFQSRFKLIERLGHYLYYLRLNGLSL